MKNIPLALIIFRLCCAPLILVLSYAENAHRSTIVALITFGFISDILDGIIARKNNVATPEIRRLDSRTDLIFWLCVGLACWNLNAGLLQPYSGYIILVLALEFMCYAVSFLRFRKETCAHAYLSKFWGITLLMTFVSMIGFDYAGWTLQLCIVTGIVSQIDTIVITCVLPAWTHDVPSSYHAWRIRKNKFNKNHLYN